MLTTVIHFLQLIALQAIQDIFFIISVVTVTENKVLKHRSSLTVITWKTFKFPLLLIGVNM